MQTPAAAGQRRQRPRRSEEPRPGPRRCAAAAAQAPDGPAEGSAEPRRGADGGRERRGAPAGQTRRELNRATHRLQHDFGSD